MDFHRIFFEYNPDSTTIFMNMLKTEVIIIKLRWNELDQSTFFIAISKEVVWLCFLVVMDHVGSGMGGFSLVGIPSMFDAGSLRAFESKLNFSSFSSTSSTSSGGASSRLFS